MIDCFRCKICGNIHPGQPCATNPTTFTWKFGGDEVSLRGSWTKFQVSIPLVRQKEYPFWHTTTIDLLVGSYQYKYIVNNEWKHDPSEPMVTDGNGGMNNQIEVLAKRVSLLEQEEYLPDDFGVSKEPFGYEQKDGQICRIRTHLEEPKLKVIGSWDNWETPIQLTRRFISFSEIWEYHVMLKLKPGVYQYIFKSGDKYMHDISYPCTKNPFGTNNNIISIQSTKRQRKANQQHEIKQVKWSAYKLNRTAFDKIHGHSMNKIGDKIYVFGGVCTGTFTNNIFQIDREDHQMKLLDDCTGEIPDERAFHLGSSYGNKILYFSGLNATSVLDDFFAFNAVTHQWNKNFYVGDRPSLRERGTFTLYPNEEIMIYFGGYFCSEYLEDEQIFNDVYLLNVRFIRWRKMIFKKAQPAPRYSHTATQTGPLMYIFGGLTNNNEVVNKNFNDIWLLNLNLDNIEWEQLLPKGQSPEPRHGHSAVYMQNKIFIFGGQAARKRRLNDVWFYDIPKNEWVQPKVVGEPPIERFYHAAISVRNSEMWVLGGNVGLQKNQNLHILTLVHENGESDVNSNGDQNFQANGVIEESKYND